MDSYTIQVDFCIFWKRVLKNADTINVLDLNHFNSQHLQFVRIALIHWEWNNRGMKSTNARESRSSVVEVCASILTGYYWSTNHHQNHDATVWLCLVKYSTVL